MAKRNFRLDHISVCICTFKRPSLLKHLLEKLQFQRTNGQFTYSVIVVDNDCDLSGQRIVEEISGISSIIIRYVSEPRQNISLARNKAIENAHGSHVAFIDDDEFPSSNWLLNLYAALNRYEVSGGVLGPVLPYYPNGTPQWLIKSRMCERPNHPTGTILGWNMARTGNVLMPKEIFDGKGHLFDAKYGRTGGEDKELFKVLIQHGYSFVWCNEAAVYEVVYPDRWKLSHYLYRSLMNGGVTGESMAKDSGRYFIRSLISLICYMVLLCVSILRGKNIIYKYIIRVVYDIGRVMGCLGVVFVKERHE
jgi:succinoglycan biosynthesis protein ExoM